MRKRGLGLVKRGERRMRVRQQAEGRVEAGETAEREREGTGEGRGEMIRKCGATDKHKSGQDFHVTRFSSGGGRGRGKRERAGASGRRLGRHGRDTVTRDPGKRQKRRLRRRRNCLSSSSSSVLPSPPRAGLQLSLRPSNSEGSLLTIAQL